LPHNRKPAPRVPQAPPPARWQTKLYQWFTDSERLQARAPAVHFLAACHPRGAGASCPHSFPHPHTYRRLLRARRSPSLPKSAFISVNLRPKPKSAQSAKSAAPNRLPRSPREIRGCTVVFLISFLWFLLLT